MRWQTLGQPVVRYKVGVVMRKFWIVCFAVGFLGACDSGKERGIKGNDPGNSQGQEDTLGGDKDVSGSEGDDGAGHGGDDALDETDGSGNGEASFARSCDENKSCSRGACRSGVCIEGPAAGFQSYVSDPKTGTLTAERPLLDCVDVDIVNEDEVQEVTLFGAVTRFGKGRVTKDMKVEVLLAEGYNPTECEGLSPGETQTQCYRNYGTVIASSVSRGVDAIPRQDCDEHAECPLGYQCLDSSGLGTGVCTEQFGLYEIEGVPTNTPLIVRTYATVNERIWRDTYMFNIILRNAHVEDGRVQYDVQMVSEGQWILTPNTVGLSEMRLDEGAIGGRIRDCSTPYGLPISDVSVALAKPGEKVVYFNDLEDDTVPLVDKNTTDILGRFAALKVPLGWNRIAGAGRIGDDVKSMGSERVYVVPNALVIVSWPGVDVYWQQ